VGCCHRNGQDLWCGEISRWETESQVVPSLVPEALTDILIPLAEETESDCCWIAVLPNATVNDRLVGVTEKVVPPCSAQARGIPIGIIAKNRAAAVTY
jgi:hypothetical protein